MIAVGQYGKIGRKYTENDEWESLSANTYFDRCLQAEFTSPEIAYAHLTMRGGGVPSGLLLKSLNGGNSWESVLNQMYHGSFDFLDNKLGYAVRNEWDALKLYQTNNGGNSWNQIYSFGEVHYYYDLPIKLTFYDSLSGICTFNEYVFKTEDAGNNWQNILVLFDSFDAITSINYRSLDTIYFTKYGPIPVIIKTVDGGILFSYDTLDVPTTYPYTEKISFINHSTGFLLINSYESDTGFIYKTTDGGENWYPTIINDSNYSSYKNIFFATDDVGYVVGSGTYTTMLKTLDGGESWNPIDIPCSSALTHLHFHDEWHGLVFGNGGVIMETLSGGVVNMEENPFVSSLAFFDISPNPSKNSVQIKFKEPIGNKLIIEVFNLNGECVFRKSENNLSATNNYTIDMKGYLSGLYFCRITDGNKVGTRTIVKL